MYVEYSSNNSGGDWWLGDKDWKALEAAGWKVVWASLDYTYEKGTGDYIRDEDGTPSLVPTKGGAFAGKPDKNGDYRWLGALAKAAFRTGLSLRDAVDEWERVTGQCATDAGCPCCGQPHTFTLYNDEGDYVESGPHTSYSASW